MIRKLMRLSDGTEIFSGPGSAMNIRSCTVTQCVNSGDELTIGSVCAACAELVIQAPANTIKAEDTFTLYNVDDAGTETKIGLFNVAAAPKKGENLFKITAYDNVVKLDKDLSGWLSANVAYLSDPRDFIDGVCSQCGLTVKNYPPYGDFDTVNSFSVEGKVTGRKLLQWVSEMLCCFCVANEDGEICFRWYVDNTAVVLGASSGRYRLQGSYKYNGTVLPIDGVRIFPAGGNVHNYPQGTSHLNPYEIRDNPILSTKDQSHLLQIAEVILKILNTDSGIFASGGTDHLAACEVTTPASQDVQVGDIIVVNEQEPAQGETHTARVFMRVMTKIQKGQMDTLKCTGSYRRPN